MNRRNRNSGILHTAAMTAALLLISMTVTVSSWAQPVSLAGLPKPPNNLRDEATLSKIIEDGYERLSRFTAISKSPVIFELSNFRTLSAEDFDTVYWVDVASTPGGDVINISREFYEDGERQRIGVSYNPQWDQLEDYMLSPEGGKVSAMTMAQVLALAAEEEEGLAEVTSMTSYDVRAELAGRTRIYRAMYLWIDEEPRKGADIEFHVIDNIVQGVAESYADPLDAGMSRKQIEKLRRAQLDRSRLEAPAQSKIFEMCRSEDSGGRTSDKSNFKTNGHSSGAHGPFASVRFDCPCEEDCGQECLPSGSWEACQEFGDANTCHRLSTIGFNVSTEYVPDALNGSPAGCRYAMACSWKACIACACGSPTVSVGVSGKGAEASFSYTFSAGSSNVSMDIGHNCRQCREDPDSMCPILINLDGGSFPLTGIEQTVAFDMSANGSSELISWTVPDSGDAFLVLDRNGNGSIDTGKELFGNFTDQPPSEVPNGYLALSVFDLAENGGDGDGWISASDAVFSGLELWVDRNHDATSQASEMYSLADQGIAAIGLDYRESRRRDRHGNDFRYAGLVKMVDHRTLQSVDVFFLLDDR